MDEVFGDLILCGVHNKQHTVCFFGVSGDFSWKCVSIATALFRDLLHRNHIANMAVMLRCSVPQKTGRDIDRQSQRAKKKKSLHSQAESSQCWCCKSAAISKFPALFPITVLTETVKVLRSRCWKKFTNVRRNPPYTSICLCTLVYGCCLAYGVLLASRIVV